MSANSSPIQKQVGATTPRVSLWLTGLKETVDQLPEFVRLAAQMGVTEVHLQRLVFDEIGYGKATAANSLFESRQEAERRVIEAAQEIARPLGVTLDASGATEPGLSLKRQDDRAWAACRRPWSLMYFTAHGRALPCCIAPFSVRGYSNYTLGDATQQELREIWNSPAYRDFRSSLLSDAPPAPCQNCGIDGACDASARAGARACRVIIPTFNEAETIGGVVREIPRDIAGTHRRRWRQH